MKLQVVMLDTHRTYVAVVHENEHIPYGRRLVTVELTAEQVELLRPRHVGNSNGSDRFEEYGPAWLETNAPAATPETKKETP